MGVRGGKCEFFTLEGKGGGDVRGISYQELGANQGFKTPIGILGIFEKVSVPGGG